MEKTLDRVLTQEEREEAMRLFGDSPTRLRNVKQITDETLRMDGLEALANGDSDIENTIKYLEKAANNQENCGLTYAILDVDKMSKINDKYGEAVGDKILSYVRDTANYVLREKAYYIGRPTVENKLTHGDQLILILNHAYLPEEDLNSLRSILKASVAARVYEDLQKSFPSMPAGWQDLKDEEVSVSIGYVAVRDARVQTKKEGGERICSSATLLRDIAIRQVMIAKRKGGDIIVGLN